MKTSWRLIAFGGIVFVIVLIANVPADFLFARLQSRGVMAAGVTGSIWNGGATALQVGGTNLGAVSWRVKLFPLFAGRLSANLDAKHDDGAVNAHVSVKLNGAITVSQLRGAFPISALGGLGLPGRWQGSVRLNFATLELKDNWPTAVNGVVEALNLVGPAHSPVALGDFRVEFDPNNQEGGVKGTLTSTGEGPLDVVGTLSLLPDRNYEVNAQVATRANASTNIVNALQYLGPPDEQGRRPFAMSGRM